MYLKENGMKLFQLMCFLLVSGLSTTSMAETLTFEKVLQKVIDHYPSVNTAAIEIERRE